jgi:uncharacterized FlaG/YvyC family protein
MKIIVSIALLIIALSIGYYFVIYLPQKDQQQRQMQQQSQDQAQDFTKQKECMTLGEKQYAQDKADPGNGNVSDPAYHFNKKLNTCVYSVQEDYSFELNWKCAAYTINVTDLLSNNVLLTITRNGPTCQTTMNQDAFDKQYKALFTE